MRREAYERYLLGQLSELWHNTHICDFLQVMLRMLLTPEEILKTRDKNQTRFTALPNRLFVFSYENCSVAAVTLEKKVAIVVIDR